MPTNVTEFDRACYATSYALQGSRIVVHGTHRSDRAGVRAWLAAAGHPSSGAYLTPAPGTAPGFYVKPYVADVYYRIDPETGVNAWDGLTQFAAPIPVTERDGFRGATTPSVGADGVAASGRRNHSPPAGEEPASPVFGPPEWISPATRPPHRGMVMRYTGIALVLMGVMIGLYAGVGVAWTPPATVGVTAFLLAVALGSLLAGSAVLAFGGRGYSRSEAV